MDEPRQALIGAGANLGHRAETLRQALARLAHTPGIQVIATSSLYATAPVGFVDQPEFLNLVVAVETTLSPEDLLRRLLAIEAEFGRVRTVRWGPRTLDLDLLAYEGETRASLELTLPHPRMFERAFVTIPLTEVMNHPQLAARWAPLRAQLAAVSLTESGVRRVT